MKINKTQLKQIIKEELARLLINENIDTAPAFYTEKGGEVRYYDKDGNLLRMGGFEGEDPSTIPPSYPPVEPEAAPAFYTEKGGEVRYYDEHGNLLRMGGEELPAGTQDEPSFEERLASRSLPKKTMSMISPEQAAALLAMPTPEEEAAQMSLLDRGQSLRLRETLLKVIKGKA